MRNENFPDPGSAEELERFARLQRSLSPMFERLLGDPGAPRTVIVAPSLSLDARELAKIAAVHHYEERLLCLLLQLHHPRTHLIFITSQPLDPAIVDYYLHLLPGIPTIHARRRLTLLDCHDASLIPLTRKILERPRLMQRIRDAIHDPDSAHLVCFSPSTLERTLAVRLNVPLYACDPALSHLGHKSGCRTLFREAGVPLPDGFEQLRDTDDLVQGLTELKQRHPDLGQAVVKLDEGFSGEGNALFDYDGLAADAGLERRIREELPRRLGFTADQETWDDYRSKLEQMGGIVECFVDGAENRSPSVQCRIDPRGRIELISTHEQVLGGPSNQIFLGCLFPADAHYRQDLQEAGLRIAAALRDQGVIGRFGVDFVACREQDRWRLHALEINLRKGGTTHTYMMLQYLTDGRYDPETGLYRTRNGQPRYYYATDNLHSDAYRGLTPEDLIDIAVEHGLHFHGASQQGVVFHLIGALSEFGKLGMVCVADSEDNALRLQRDTIAVLDSETGGRRV